MIETDDEEKKRNENLFNNIVITVMQENCFNFLCQQGKKNNV